MEPPHECPMCPATFPDEDGMWAHHRDVHEPHMDWEPANPPICLTCGGQLTLARDGGEGYTHADPTDAANGHKPVPITGRHRAG